MRVGAGIAALLVVAGAAGCGGDEPIAVDAPPGQLIAYTAGDGIHLVTADGERDWKVPGTGPLSGPSWAPDGKRFAGVDLGSCCTTYAVSLDGSERTELPASSSTTPDWSPDGRRLVVFDEDDFRLHLVDAESGDEIAEIPVSGNYPAWSPDGRSIAFQANDADDLLRIYVYSIGTGEVRRVTRVPAGEKARIGEVEAEWSPDGQRLVFSSDDDGDSDIYVVGVDGAGLRRLTANTLGDDAPTWSPDGAKIAFARTWPDETAIVVLDLDSGEETVVARGGFDLGDLVYEPAWQPLPPGS